VYGHEKALARAAIILLVKRQYPTGCRKNGGNLTSTGPAHVPHLTLFDLMVDARRLRVFLRFRMGVHGLPIDVGRWCGVPRSQRTCDMCDTGAVGDEHHFVVVCPALAAVRTHYAPLFALRSRTLRAFVRQPDLLLVVRYIGLFPGSCSDPQSVCWCSVESASSGWTDVTLLLVLLLAGTLMQDGALYD
jgi:hypothetical protein